MLELTRQEKQVVVFIMASSLLGVGIMCYQNLIRQPKIQVVSNQKIEDEIKRGGIVNINTAAKGELIKLEGIGPSLAGAIIERRAARGGFKDKEELKGIKGIGPAKYDGIKEYVKIE